MSFKYPSRVRQTSVTTGTGAFSLTALSNPVTFRLFKSKLSNSDSCPYLVVNRNANEWEEGRGTLTIGSPDTLSRDTILDGSNGTSAVNFSAGVKDVWLGCPSAMLQMRNGILSATSVPYVNADGLLDQDANLTWDSTNKRLATPKVVGVVSGGGLAIAVGTGAGPNGTAQITGTDVSGYITITTSVLDTPPANSDICTVTFGTAYGGIPKVIMQAANDAACQLAVGTWVCRKGDVVTTQFKLRASSLGLPAATAASYQWVFMVTQ